MRNRVFLWVVTGLLVTTMGFAKDKAKKVLPEFVLRARTVAILIDPEAGVSLEEPRANQVAQKDVETEFLKWGRFQTLIGTPGADLIIVIRRGHGKLVDQTVKDPRQNDRLGSITSTDGALGVGIQHGRQPQLPTSASGAPQTQTEVGEVDDSFLVYRGDIDNPLDSPPLWRYVAKNGLHPHDVPAVGEFRKAVIETEKASGQKPWADSDLSIKLEIE
jgi:hypothetical protein